MAVQVKLADVISALESAGDEDTSWLDRETGEVHLLTDEMMDYAEEGTPAEEIPGWMRDPVEVAKQVQEDRLHRYLELPSKSEIHEWEIMDCFASSVKNESVQRALRNGIRGAGAFSRFKQLLEGYDLWKAWNKFRDARLREMAIEWCKDSGITWREK
ncbi:MAG TPA: UPF0158 family protein [Terriglobia bacterium]|nr:UPF0158 family protein [Terriglobia bacterium]